MKTAKSLIAGILSLGLGIAAISFAIGMYRSTKELAPLMGEPRLEDYAMLLSLVGLGVAFLAVAYAYLIRRPRA